MNLLQFRFCYILFVALAASGCKKGNHVKAEAGETTAPATGGGTDGVTAGSPSGTVPFKNMLGINAFEWNFLQNPSDLNDPMHIYEPKMQINNGFGGIRHYLDWERIELQEGKFTFSPAHSGGWNLDAMYQRCKADNLEVLVCFKTLPAWFLQSYPASERDNENVPMPYGADKSQPRSYILQAKAGFQFAARYGSNMKVDPALVSVNTQPRWTADQINEVKIGLSLVKYIECDNERDKWWKGDKAYQTPEQYAANLSAFYDGHKGTLGRGVGVKAADPDMKVVMAGLARADVKYVAAMIEWCRKNRGYKTDGSVDLCFDVVNYHLYSNDNLQHDGNTATTGVAPELSEAGQVAADFVALAKFHNLPVWITEAGYDLNEHSPQRSPAIGNRSALLVQADWNIRTSLLYARKGIEKLFFYEMYDENINSWTQYASSGFITDDLKRRPSGDYVLQVKNLIGDYRYQGTINEQPLVDIYKNGTKTIYALVVPAQSNKTVSYTLKIAAANQVVVHNLVPGSATTAKRTEQLVNGTLNLTVTESPVFVEVQ